MAGNSIRISTDQVEEIASTLERLNNELTEKLNESRETITGLREVWSGDAADTTISTYETFANNYFQNYEDVITQYVVFLRNNISAEYTSIEEANKSLGDSFI